MGSLEPTDTSTTQLLHLMLTEHHQRENGKDYESQRTKKICCEIVSSRNDGEASPMIPQ